MIKLTWVFWDFPHAGIGRYNAHIKMPGHGITACGIETTLASGAREIGVFGPTERPPNRSCCSACLRMRAAVAEQIKLAAWKEATA